MGQRSEAGIENALLGAIYKAFTPPNILDWNTREEIAYQELLRVLETRIGGQISREGIYLGGDSLRPYLMVSYGEVTALVCTGDSSLSTPKLIRMLEEQHRRGEAIKRAATNRGVSYTVWEFSVKKLGPGWEKLPDVYLSTLTNMSRYRTRRYPLNVGRLAQWLRFQHAARVRATDFALDFDGRIDLLIDQVHQLRPQILGLSLNFGELECFRDFISVLRQTEFRPVICLGNVLAAWACQEIKEICRDFRCIISPSYGENDLERICRLLACDSMTERDATGENKLQNHSKTFPSAIVMPDERLLAETLLQGGQASLETSFGCQYGHCTFCPRDHRGTGWCRPVPLDAAAVIRRISALILDFCGKNAGVLSIVDEDAFGQEGRNPASTPYITQLVNIAANAGISCEIYTRLEQILDPHWDKEVSIERLEQFKMMRGSLTRVFIGVESGSDSQLRRYGKGQTIENMLPALRAGSLLGLPLEFGFITFDPLLTQDELYENIAFLGRRDVLIPTDATLSPSDVYALATAEYVQLRGKPLFTCVAYMATELEIFVNSPFLRFLRENASNLVGRFDATFARYEYTYRDINVARVAHMCRVWTEGAFEPIYRIRLADRAARNARNPYREVIGRYRRASYGLLLSLAYRNLEELRPQLLPLWTEYCSDLPLSTKDEVGLSQLAELWKWVRDCETGVGIAENVQFRLEHLERRRDT